MAKQKINIQKLKKQDISKAAHVLVDAFQKDPIWETLFKKMEDENKPFAFEVPIRYSLRYGGVLTTSDKIEGIATWVSEKYANMTMLRILFSGAMSAGIKMGSKLEKMMKPIFTPMLKDRKEFMKGRKYMYIQVIGVATAFQGQGFGGALIKKLIEISEQRNNPIYLETETEENLGLYEKYGFKVIKKITLPILELPLWEMIRE